MVRAHCWYKIVILLITADAITPLIENKTSPDVNSSLKKFEARRSNKKKKSLSTSSESGDRKSSERDSDDSLELSSSSSSSSIELGRGYKPISTENRTGWRKWHRRCTLCPDDMIKKWRDRSISWICGGYQRARRSFKSDCMMYYRNCQDGTMFVKIHDYRCQNDTYTGLQHGLHFFYEYGKDSETSKSSSLSDTDSLPTSSELYV